MGKVGTVIAFVAGAALGSVATWQLLKKKYEQLAQEEIDSVKEVFAKRYSSKAEDEQSDSEDAATRAKQKPSVMEYAAKVRELGYTNYADMNEPEEEEEDNPVQELANRANKVYREPYIIEPEEFGEEDGYEIVSLTYYDDKVLADDQDEVVHDIEATVGAESLTTFGEYADDAVYVRNERLQIDYEILRSLKTYTEVIEESPYKAGV